jgi:hypothetical protein
MFIFSPILWWSWNDDHAWDDNLAKFGDKLDIKIHEIYPWNCICPFDSLKSYSSKITTMDVESLGSHDDNGI